MVKKRLFFILCLITSWQMGRAQNDIGAEILNRKPTQLELIMRGRTYVFDEYCAGNKQKTKELFYYLVQQEDSSTTFPFYLGEKMLIHYWLGDFDAVLGILEGKDSALLSKNAPPDDFYFDTIIGYAQLRRDSIHAAIDKIIVLDLKTKAFLKLKYDDLIVDETKPINQDSLNKEADAFLIKYPYSRYENYIRSNIRFVYKQSNWGLGFEFFSGYGIFTDGLSNSFSNVIPIGIAFDIQYKKFVLSLRDYLGFVKTVKPLTFDAGVWAKDEYTLALIPEASLGYVIVDNSILKMAPFVGIASTNIAPGDVESEGLGLEFTTTYTAGACLDFKLPGKHKKVPHHHESGGGFIRLRYAYTMPQFDKKYPGFDGVLHSITIGFGGFSRPYKRAW